MKRQPLLISLAPCALLDAVDVAVGLRIVGANIVRTAASVAIVPQGWIKSILLMVTIRVHRTQGFTEIRKVRLAL